MKKINKSTKLKSTKLKSRKIKLKNDEPVLLSTNSEAISNEKCESPEKENVKTEESEENKYYVHIDECAHIVNVPLKIQKQMAAEIQKHILAGSINPETDFPGLIANGLDPSAIDEWKLSFSQCKNDKENVEDVLKSKQHFTRNINDIAKSPEYFCRKNNQKTYDPMSDRVQISDLEKFQTVKTEVPSFIKDCKNAQALLDKFDEEYAYCQVDLIVLKRQMNEEKIKFANTPSNHDYITSLHKDTKAFLKAKRNMAVLKKIQKQAYKAFKELNIEEVNLTMLSSELAKYAASNFSDLSKIFNDLMPTKEKYDAEMERRNKKRISKSWAFEDPNLVSVENSAIKRS